MRNYKCEYKNRVGFVYEVQARHSDEAARKAADFWGLPSRRFVEAVPCDILQKAPFYDG